MEAQDNTVKAFAIIAAWLHDAQAVKLIYGAEEGVQTRIKQAQEAKKKCAESGEVVYIPSIKKLSKGEFSKIDKGNPPSNLPDEEIINAPTPPIVLTPRKTSKKR